MKTTRLLALLCFLGVSLPAQPPASVPLAGAGVVSGGRAADAPSVRRTGEELDQLLAPIALYPDALIALILPAATAPTDIVLAARHLRDNPSDRSQIEHRAWDDSVKSLANYPEILDWMDENLTWTKQVGEAFAGQPADTMQAIQRLRAKARAAGTLVDTPQQQVLAEPQVIRIVPAQPDIIYVPRYEPEIVFVDQPVYYARPFLTFGIGVPVGSWLAFDCDWRRNAIWVGDRHRRWAGQDWHRPLVPIAPVGPSSSYRRPPEVVRQWQPAPVAARSSFTASRHFRTDVARPTPIGLTPPRPSSSTVSFAGRTPNDSSPTAPVVGPLPRSFPSNQRNDYAGPRGPRVPAAGAPALATPTSPVVPPPAQAPVSSPPPVRDRGQWTREADNRARGGRSTVSNATPPLPTVPSLPMATLPSAPAIMPAPARTRMGSLPANVVPALPMANRAAAPVATGPVAAPASIPAEQTTPAQPAPSRNNESRGRSGGGRREENSSAR